MLSLAALGIALRFENIFPMESKPSNVAPKRSTRTQDPKQLAPHSEEFIICGVY
jgi:hypothetical protein